MQQLTCEVECSFCKKNDAETFIMFTKDTDVNICSECVLELSKMLMTKLEMELHKPRTNVE